jgi:Tfp pilus assembly protein PilX
MNEQGKRNAAEKGSALIFALLAILVLSVLAATVMFTSQSQIWTSLNYRQTAQARYVAEAGVQATINWLSNSTGSTAYIPPTIASSYPGFTVTAYPVKCTAIGNGCTSTTLPVMLSSTSSSSNYYDTTGNVATNFAAVASGTVSGITGASYKTTAQLLRMPPATTIVSWLSGPAQQTWQITSVGTVQGVTTSTVQVVQTFDRLTTPVFTNGLETTSNACGSITFTSSGSYTDSYNSNNGPYSPGSTGNNQASGGNIGTNGNVYLGSGVTVNGTITAENTIVATSNQAGTSPNPPCLNGVTNKTGHTATSTPPFDQGTYKEPATFVPKRPWGCAPLPATCYPPPVVIGGVTQPNITTPQNINSQCASMTGCSTGAAVNVYDGNGSNHSGSTISANVYTLAPGSYGNLVIGNTSSNNADVTVVHVSAGTYNINSIDMGNSDAQVVIDSGPVVFNMVGNCSSSCPSYSESGMPSSFSNTEIVHISGAGGLNACKPSGPTTGTVANPGSYGNVSCGGTATKSGSTYTWSGQGPFSGIPANMQFVYGGTNTVRLGGMPFAAAIYAPAASYFTPGSPVGLYGSVIAANFYDSSGSPWHYDNALGATGMKVGGYKSLGFSWTKF